MKAKVISLEKALREREKRRKKSKARKKNVVLVTSYTEKEFAREVKKRGDFPPHRCYLCGSRKGENRITFDEKGHMYSSGTVLKCYSVKLGEVGEVRFLLCLACRVLLQGLQKDLGDEYPNQH